MQLSKSAGLTLLLSSSLTLVHAAEVTFNGFLSVGAGYLDVEENAGLANLDPDSTFADRYFGYTDGNSAFNLQNKFGFQVNAQLDDKFSLTGQFVSRGVDNYDTEVEWAYMSYQFSDSLTARFGKLRVPLYMFSDFLEVGYAYPWITPPRETYTIAPISSFDGVDLVHTISFGNWYSLVQAYHGSNDDVTFVPNFDEFFQLDIDDFSGLTWTLSNDNISFRIGYHYQDSLSANSTSLDQTVASLQAGAAALQEAARLFAQASGLDALATSANAYTNMVNELDVQGKSAEFFAVGLEVDWENFVFIGEWTSLKFDPSLLRNSSPWYMTFGYRYEDFLFHYTYEQIDIEDVSSYFVEQLDLGIDYSLFGEVGNAFLAAFTATSTRLKQTLDGTKRFSHAIGLRYDLSHSTALKAEFQHSTQEIYEFQGFTADGAESRSYADSTSLLFTVGFDLVF